MKVLVTGLNGFTGIYLKRELEQHGHTVFGLAADLTDWAAVEQEVREVKPEAVVHLAAISFVPAGDSQDVYTVNTLGAQGLLEALTKLPYALKKVILASSSSVYGLREGLIDESMCPKPVNHYGCSKLAMECIAETFMAMLPIVIARPFNYTGVGQADNFLVPKIVSHFKMAKDVIELGNIDVERDFSDVRWIVKAYRMLLERGKEGGCYNLCSGKSVSIQSIIAMLEEITGHSMSVKVNSDFVRAVEIRRQCGDPKNIRELMVGDAGVGLKETLEWLVCK